MTPSNAASGNAASGNSASGNTASGNTASDTPEPARSGSRPGGPGAGPGGPGAGPGGPGAGPVVPGAARRDPYDGFAGRVGRTFAASAPAWPPRHTAPAGAPNVVVVLTDDMGYSDIGPFGSEIPTPVLDALAADGVRLSNYHTMPLCSPARAALLTGLNPHRVGYASVANSDPGFPGYGMEVADDVPTLAELLHDTGYATYAVGKWHLVRDSASNAADDLANWPLQKGFDRYYGVLEGLTSLFHPHQLVRDNTPLDVESFPEGYYHTDDLTDQAISMVTSLRAHDRTSPSSCTCRTTPCTARSRPEPRTSNGTAAATTTAGTRCASGASPPSSPPDCSRPAPNCPSATARPATTCPPGTR
ncbi:hypothetical protein GCM10018793_48120 [Streptomyces sulfonofaciens]|uniref:Sulfatase N-terminal domain-containing protein n=1 Tax=Streptomyces sulfonofaciens TaxID=68272 RepID=A0A919GGV8_9ACTN|nr:hypothetical protein GCM10018793_48120 [Streptomyces sulfonofaciens]